MPNTRDELFVPLTPATLPANQRTDFRLTILSQPDNAQAFRPLGSPSSAQSPAHGSACEPRVAVQREGDRVSSIQIQCGCGQVIELACVYEPASASKPA
jgi:hypothetical protein